MAADDSVSMELEENGTRKITMKDTMKAITEVYDLANDLGLLSVQCFNSDMSIVKVKNKNVYSVWKKCTYGGVTRIGSALREKILDRYVWGPVPMKKPLLVMTITDGAVSSFLPPSACSGNKGADTCCRWKARGMDF